MGEAIVRQVAKRRRIGFGMPLNFSRFTSMDRTWRWMSAACLALCVLPISLTLPMGWVFAVRAALVCLVGAWRPHPQPIRLSLLGLDLLLLLWWMFGGYPQSLTQLAVAAFVLGASFKAMELRRVADGYMASVMCFLGPFLAVIQSLPWWALAGSSLSILAALVLRSGLACIESGTVAGSPWRARHWKPVAGLAFMTLPLALASFWLLPRLDAPFFGNQRMGQTGMSGTMEPGSMDAMFQDPSTALLVSFKGASPDPGQMYWRAATLSVFDGRSWSPIPLSPAAETLPQRTPGLEVFSYDMKVMPQQSNYIPFMDRVLSTSGLRTVPTYTLANMSSDPSHKMRSYSGVSSPNVLWATDGLSDQARRSNLLLPADYNPRTKALVEKWGSEGYRGKALADHALLYFRDNMTYSYTPPLLGRDSVDELVFDTKEGFCEHFSSSFTFMMRAAGIPARVVTGYQAGRQLEDGNWEVRQLDAHAWSEIWLADKGWIRVDPTMAVVRKRPPPPGEEKFQGFNSPLVQWATEQSAAWFGDFNSQRQQDLFSGWKIENWSHWAIALGAVLVVLFWALSAFWWDWGGVRLPREVAQFEKLRRLLLAATGLGPSATPRQISQAMAPRLTPQGHEDLSRVLQDWEDWRYGGRVQEDLSARLKDARKALRQWRRPPS